MVFLFEMVVSDFCFDVNSQTYGDYGALSLFRFDNSKEETKMACFFRDGFGYTFHHENKDGSIYRKCKCHRSEKCNAALKCLLNGSIIASGVLVLDASAKMVKKL
jgi:hypothetical protein